MNKSVIVCMKTPSEKGGDEKSLQPCDAGSINTKLEGKSKKKNQGWGKISALRRLFNPVLRALTRFLLTHFFFLSLIF